MWLREQDGVSSKCDSQAMETLVLLLLNLPDAVPCSLHCIRKMTSWLLPCNFWKPEVLTDSFSLAENGGLKWFLCPITEIDYLSILCFCPLTRLNCWAYVYYIKKSTGLMTSLPIPLIGWVSRFYVLQIISPWSLPSLPQSVVFDFLANTADGAIACILIILIAFWDFSLKGLLDMVLKSLYWIVFSIQSWDSKARMNVFDAPSLVLIHNSCQYLSSSSYIFRINIGCAVSADLYAFTLRDVFLSHRSLWLLSRSFPRTSAEDFGLPVRDVR